MNVDHFLKMGDDHTICEDYIISGLEPIPYVILADGCSTAKNTDVGARLMCYLAKKHLVKYKSWDYNASIEHVMYSALNIADSLNLAPDSLTATLMVAFVKNEAVHVFCYGDGNVFAMGRDEQLWFANVSFTGNAPYYPRYRIGLQAAEDYRKLDSDMIIDRKYTSCLEDYDNEVSYVFPLDEWETVMIASDGIDSVSNTSPDIVAIDAILLKSTKKRFILRRMRKVIRDYRKQGLSHFDDISVGGFHHEL